MGRTPAEWDALPPASRAFLEAGAMRAWTEFGVTPLGLHTNTDS